MIVGTVLYPVLVYFGLSVVPPGVFVLLALGLFGLRLAAQSGAMRTGSALGLFIVLAGSLIVLLLVRPLLAVMVYPVLVSLTVAAIFIWSLIYPPSAIERMARRRQPALPAATVIYTRNLTMVWVVFLLGNAFVAVGLAIWASVAAWTIWTGLIAYMLIGALLVGEWLLRDRLQRGGR